jgi:hypothetical protein
MKQLRVTATVTLPDEMFAEAEAISKAKAPIATMTAALAEAMGGDHVKVDSALVTVRKPAKKAAKAPTLSGAAQSAASANR